MYAEAAHAPPRTIIAGIQPVPRPAAMPAASASIPPPMMFFAIDRADALPDICPGGAGTSLRFCTSPPRRIPPPRVIDAAVAAERMLPPRSRSADPTALRECTQAGSARSTKNRSIVPRR